MLYLLIYLLSANAAFFAAQPQFSNEYTSCRASAGQNIAQLNVCDQAELGKQDSRLNQVYRRIIEQLGTDLDGKFKLRNEERSWVKKRDADCRTGNDSVGNKCLLERTAERTSELDRQHPSASTRQPIPEVLWGKWVVKRVLPAETISCWGQKEADALIGTELEYSAHVFRWKNSAFQNAGGTQTVVGAADFENENSGGGPNDSRVTFRQLGIEAPSTTQIAISHSDAPSSGPSVDQIPGDSLLLKDSQTIIFSVCNVYFEAKRRLDHSAR